MFTDNSGQVEPNGLSLFGFLDETAAIARFRHAAAGSHEFTDESILNLWRAARARLGPPVSNAGQPEVLDLPEDQMGYVEALNAQHWVREATKDIGPFDYRLVEIDPLLAFQVNINLNISERFARTLTDRPNLDELVRYALPFNQPEERYEQSELRQDADGWNSVDVSVPNFSPCSWCVADADCAGLKQKFVGVSISAILPFIHVVRLSGRCCLWNGYHRAIALRQLGFTHVPCMFREPSKPKPHGEQHFELSLLQSANPPTIGHFTQGRAFPMRLKKLSRTLRFYWAEFFEEEQPSKVATALTQERTAA